MLRDHFDQLSRVWALLLLASLTGCGDGGGSATTDSSAARLHAPSGRVLYVSATAVPGGDGTRAAPFASLAALEAASAPGDALVVLPAPLDIPPLDGGIALKPRQRLVGAGPDVVQQRGNAAVTGATQLPALPRIRNTSPLRLNGDAVRLAADSEVSNLVITEAQRGAIYGLDVPGVVIHGNDVSGYNPLCLIGFTVEPFTAPTRLPLFGVPAVLPAGWAGIMVDASGGHGAITITNNYVHNSACGNGIDVRINGAADYLAEISGNFITELQHGPGHQTEELHLVHAITLQITDSSRLEANSVNNTQTFIGSPGADCEGLFMNLSDSATGLWRVDGNIFEHGIGGFSCNGVEFIVSNGSAHGEMTIRNSRFIDNPGDMIQQDNLGSGSTLILELDNVIVRDTHERGGNPEDNPLPFNLGECILAGSTGNDNTTILRVRDSDFSNCNNGLTLLSGMNLTTNLLGAVTTGELPEDVPGADGLFDVEISNSRFRNNAFNNLIFGVIAPLREFNLKVENSDLAMAGETAVALKQLDLGNVQQARIDFGGGELGSAGGNCIFGGGRFDVVSEGLAASLQHNWWGQPGGPVAGRISQTVPDSMDIQDPLDEAPAVCAE